jgi:hypothetical protein
MEKKTKEGIQELKELMDNYKYKFERFEGWLEYHLLYSKSFDIELLPSLSFFIDRQMNETWIDNNGDLIPSTIGVGLAFRWLGLNIGIQINFKTNKPFEL